MTRELTDNAALTDNETLAAGLRVGVMRLARRLRREREDGDLTPTQLAVLNTLERRGACSLGELATEERISAPSVTRIIASLVDTGLITRRCHDSDGRQVVVELTPAATTLLERNRHLRNLWLAEQLRSLTDDQRVTLTNALAVLDVLAKS